MSMAHVEVAGALKNGLVALALALASATGPVVMR